MSFSMLPILFVLQFAAIIMATRYASTRNAIGPGAFAVVALLLTLLAVWGVASGWLAYTGAYQSHAFLSSWPSLWITFVPVAIFMSPLAFKRGRKELRALIDNTPVHWVTGLQCLRILAIGGIIKGLNGEFALYFALLVGVPDLLFGLSGFWITWKASRDEIKPKQLA